MIPTKCTRGLFLNSGRPWEMSDCGQLAIACPGDTVAVVPKSGVIKVDRAIDRVGDQLRACLPGIRRDSEKRFRVQTCSKRYSAKVHDKVIGIVAGAVTGFLICACAIVGKLATTCPACCSMLCG